MKNSKMVFIGHQKNTFVFSFLFTTTSPIAKPSGLHFPFMLGVIKYLILTVQAHSWQYFDCYILRFPLRASFKYSIDRLIYNWVFFSIYSTLLSRVVRFRICEFFSLSLFLFLIRYWIKFLFSLSFFEMFHAVTSHL